MDASPTAAEIWEGLLGALDALGVSASWAPVGSQDREWDASGIIEGIPVAVKIKAVPSVADVDALDALPAPGVTKLLAGRRLSSSVRREAAERGIAFFDGMGRLRLVRPPVVIDTEVPPLRPSLRRRRLRAEGGAVLDVALAVLNGDAGAGVRAIAPLVDRAPGTVSKALALLRSEHLVTIDGQPAVPDLFSLVLDDWRPHRVPLADLPRPGDGRTNRRLQVGFEPDDETGWVLADAHAAAAWGAPVILDSTAPPDFYVPNRIAVAQALALFGEASFGHHACTVALAPAPMVCRRRYDRAAQVDQVWFAPAPVVAALDLASDPARGRETLEAWSQVLPTEVARVW